MAAWNNHPRINHPFPKRAVKHNFGFCISNKYANELYTQLLLLVCAIIHFFYIHFGVGILILVCGTDNLDV